MVVVYAVDALVRARRGDVAGVAVGRRRRPSDSSTGWAICPPAPP